MDAEVGGGEAASNDLPAGAAAVIDADRSDPRYPRDATIPELFAARVAAAPDATAVTFGAESLSYAELDARANRLAHALGERGVGAETPVGVALPRGFDLIVALLAVVKAGGAYVPLDLANPPARSAFILDDAGAALVVTSADRAAGYGSARVLALDGGAIDGHAMELAGCPSTAPPCPATADSLAYICYTSGSTGRPKGTAVPHRGVVRLVSDPDYVTLGPGESILQLCAIAFDVSAFEVWGALLTGARLVVAPPGPLTVSQIGATLRDHGVTTAWLTAGLFHQVVELAPESLAGVRQLLAGGDVLDPGAVRAALKVRGNSPVINGYGPTENSTFATCYRMTDPAQVGDRTPIGTAIPHSTAYVLDGDLGPLPDGEPGELCLGGDGVARGYVGNPALTADKFVPDPYAGRRGARMYRTGDLARRRSDGVFEFLGRLDGQVKIRGFRVEPGEVEAVLRQRPEVREAVVVVRGEGETRHLAAYVTGPAGSTPELAGALAEHAAALLPDYLVPASFTVLDRLPLNISGKVDRHALPEPAAVAATPAEPEAFTGPPARPASAVEEKLAAMWREVLRVERVDADDEFYALGGNSLAATRLMFRIRDAFGVELPLLDLYKGTTLTSIAAAVEGLLPTAGDPAATSTPTPALAPAEPAIKRRDRSAYRESAGGATTTPPEPAPEPKGRGHLVPLTGDWALWRWVCLRAPGFAFDRHGPLGAPLLAEAADRRNNGDVEAADYDAVFARAERELSVALHAAAADPRFRRAISWQNRTALATGIDALLRRDPHTVTRNSRYRQYETLVANYMQRYTAKNDTIGFFGPVGWIHVTADGPAVQHRPLPGGTLARRSLYVEDWAARLLAEALSPGLEPWLVPRRLPLAYVRETAAGARLELPFAPPVPLSPLDARVMAAIDGGRTAAEVVSLAGGEPAAWAALAHLRDLHAVAWEFDVSPADVHALRTLRERLGSVTDAALREPALAALDEMEAAVAHLDEVAARPDDGDLLGALESLDSTFTRLTGAAPTRRAGKIYAGRTLVFEDALRGDDVTFGASLFDSLADPLELILTAARWFTAAGAALFERVCLTAYRERARTTGRAEVPLAELWLDINNFLFDEQSPLVTRMARAIRERWAGVFTVPDGERRVHLRSADLRDAVMKTFAVGRAGWATAVHHSPDLMIAAASAEAIRAGDFEWVLGEIHPGLHTMRYVTWVEQHPEAAEVRRAMHADLGPVIWTLDTASYGATPARLTNTLIHPTDRHLNFAADSCGYDVKSVLHLGDFDAVEENGRLLMVSRVTGERLGLIDLFGDILGADLSQSFGIVPSAPHTPRITIDRLVVQRETWRFTVADLPWAHTVDERARYLAARRFITDHDLPRYVFARTQGEKKPVFVDLTSLSSIELLSRAIRRARSHAGDTAGVSFGEMLPTPEQLWLTDAEGRRYTCELRICATDRKGR